MPTTCPFATSFKNAVNRGTPCSVAVNNIAKKCGKTPTVIFNSLCKAGLCAKQKFNGTFVYVPTFGNPASSPKTMKTCQADMWQCFVEWCIASDCCTPEECVDACGSQAQFMNFFKKFWNKQFTGNMTAGNFKFSKNTGKMRKVA